MCGGPCCSEGGRWSCGCCPLSAGEVEFGLPSVPWMFEEGRIEGGQEKQEAASLYMAASVAGCVPVTEGGMLGRHPS